jgi:hypothetical protein
VAIIGGGEAGRWSVPLVGSGGGAASDNDDSGALGEEEDGKDGAAAMSLRFLDNCE